MTRLARALGLAVALTLAAATATAQPQAAAAPIPVEQDAPPGSSGEVAKGALIGLAVGLVLIMLLAATASTD